MDCEKCQLLEQIREIIETPMRSMAGMQRALKDVYEIINAQLGPREPIVGNYVPGLEP